MFFGKKGLFYLHILRGQKFSVNNFFAMFSTNAHISRNKEKRIFKGQ